MKLLGQFLLWAGFLVGSLLTVFVSTKEGVEYVKSLKPEDAKGFELPDLSAVTVPENGWHLIPWVWYSIAAAVCLAGVVLLHSSRRTATQKSEKSAASLNDIKLALDRAIEKVEALSKVSSTTAPSKIAARIDDEIADDLRIFADGRDSMTTEYDLSVFADVMSPFAAGERAINRAWSASADGYIDEATECLVRGHQMLVTAREELAKAE